MPRSRLLLEWLAVMAGALALAAWALSQGTTNRFDMALLDRTAIWGASPASDDILLVAIDDRSLREIGQWPWDRRRIAQLTDRIAAAKPRLIELDILFPEASQPEADAALARSVAAAGKVVLPFGFAAAEGQASGLASVQPIPELAGSAAALGHAALVPDADGSIRRAALSVAEGGQAYPQLQLAALQVLQAAPAHAYGEPPVVPLRPAGAYHSVSASAVLRGEVPSAFLQNRIVLVGATAEGLGDIHPVPYPAGSLMPGVEFQANVLQALLEGRLIGDAPFGLALVFSIVPILALFAGFWRLRPTACLVLAGALVIAMPLASAAIAHFAGVWLAPGPALLAIIIAYPLWGWRRLSALSDYLLAKSRRLAAAGATPPAAADGFDAIAREVGQLDVLVDEVSARRDFLRRVIETAPEAICVFGSDGGLVLSNGHAQALLPKAVSGEQFAAMLAAAGALPADQPDEIVLPDGRQFTLSRSAEPAREGWQAITLVTLADVTAARRAEQERRELLEFLSHDMRSPQVAILSLTARAQEPEALERIAGHARRTMQLADNFVQLARLSEALLDIEEIDLGALAAEAADRAWTLASARRITLERALPVDPLFIRADGQVFSRVLDNLIGNAVKYGRDGGRIMVSAEREQDMAVVIVADDGPGLPPDRAGDPFRRFGARDKASGGAGLGLGFVGEALARHGAEVQVESSAAKGTRFRISLAALSEA